MTCVRCGLCCKDCGDIPGGTSDRGKCPALIMIGEKATCRIERDDGKENKPELCNDYPFPDIDNGKCARELEEGK